MERPNEPDEGVEKARQFATVLRMALDDIALEKSGYELVHLWDDDSLYLPIRGALGYESSMPQDPNSRVAQALFSGGFVGSVSMLAAHRAELVGHIARWSLDSPKSSHANEQVRRLIASPAAQELMNAARLLTNVPTHSETAVHEVIRRFAQLPRESLVVLEAVWGDWRTRLQEFVDVEHLKLDPVGPTVEQAVQQPLFEQISSAVAGMRDPQRSLSTAVDAASLTSLALLCGEARNGAKLVPRYFTSSRSLQRTAARHPWLRHEFQTSGGESNGEPRDAWVPPEYYLLRATVPSLARPGIEPTVKDVPSLELEQLKTLSIELETALRGGSEAVADLLEQYDLTGDSSVSELVSNVRAVQQTQIWIEYSRRDVLPERFEALRDLQRFGAARLLSKSVELQTEVLNLLEGELRDRTLSLDILESVNEVARHFERVKAGHPLSLTEDLGSVRWGLEYSGVEDSVTLSAASGSSSNHLAEILRFYDVGHLRNNDHAARRALAVLIGLDQFSLAHRLANVLVQPESSNELFLLRTVAAVGASGHRSESSLNNLANLVKSQYAALDVESQSRLALGYAYAAFSIWQFQAHGGAWREFRSSYSGDLARWSVDVVWEAFRRSLQNDGTSTSDLSLAYAVNHVVYVCTVANLAFSDLEDLAESLERIARKLDSYRLLDTVGYYRLKKGQALPAANPVAEHYKWRTLRRAVKLLRRAHTLLESDADVQAHLDEALSSLASFERNRPVEGGLHTAED